MLFIQSNKKRKNSLQKQSRIAKTKFQVESAYFFSNTRRLFSLKKVKQHLQQIWILFIWFNNITKSRFKSKKGLI